MLRLIEGALGSPAHEMIKEEIKRHVECGKRVFMIVPEQQAVIAEVEMSEYLPDCSPLFFEVTNFTRLANTVFRSLGGVDNEYCDGVRRALIMWRTLTELSPSLSITGGRREVNAGTVERVLAATAEMQSLGIDAEQLSALDGEIDEGRLSSKVSDLVKIMTLYKKLLAEKYSDAADDVAAMTARLREVPGFFDGVLFYIDGFTSFTEPQYELIGLLSRLEDVTLHLTVPKHDPTAYEYSEPRAAKERIIKICDRLGTDKKLVRVDGAGAIPFITECTRLLWRTSGEIDNITLQNKEELKIYECDTAYDMCDFVAADIRRRVAAGARYRDFAIIARRAEAYVGSLDGALEQNRIPHFISKRTDTASFEAVKLIYTAFSIISGGYRREDVISYAKCTPSGISREACDEFELYTEKWQIGGRRFFDEGIWNMNPDGYTSRRAADCDARLTSIDATRRALIEPLRRLEWELANAKTVREHAVCLVNFLTDIDLEGTIRERSRELTALGEIRLAEENGALWRAICDSLDTLVEVSGDAPVSVDGFLSQLKVVFANADIGRIPSFYDAVTVGSADMLRLNEKKHIYLIGVNRAEFPETAGESSYFTDRDKMTLGTLGLAIEPDTEVRGARELYYFSRAMSYATESVAIVYATRTASLKGIKRAEAVDRIIEITGEEISPIRASDIAPWELLYSPEAALGSLGKLDTGAYQGAKDALFEAGLGERVTIAERRPENSSLTLSPAARALLFRGPLALTQSRIDAYNSCPLSYFLKYQLSLLPEERAEFDAMNIGTFIHAILEGVFGDIARQGVPVREITDEAAREAVHREAKRYLASVNSDGASFTKRDEVLLERLTEAAMPVVRGLCDEFRESDFVPRYFELKIGGRGRAKDDGLPEPCEFIGKDGERVFVYGTIDRVDTFRHGDELYVRVVDYKTGQKVFSPSDIERGENLQMFLYLKSIVDTKNKKFLDGLGTTDGKAPIPAGVIYVKAEIGDVRISHPDAEASEAELMKAQGRQGMMLNEPEVINATGTKYAPVKFTKSGAPDKRYADKLYTRADWCTLCERMSEVVTDVAGRMKSGDIGTHKADEDSCKYCKFKPFCRSAKYGK